MSTILIDYGAGNLRSVANALQTLQAEVTIIAHGDSLPADAQRIILPGVGSFGDSMTQLNARGLSAPLRNALANNVPFLGICVGYQLLFQSSEESPDIAGLGILAGHVKRFQPGKKIPHMGWNSATLAQPSHPLWQGLQGEISDPYFYYVHSYFPVPEDPAIIAATTDYQEKFAAAVITKNIHAVQFHPEKSQDSGLQLIKNFLTI